MSGARSEFATVAGLLALAALSSSGCGTHCRALLEDDPPQLVAYRDASRGPMKFTVNEVDDALDAAVGADPGRPLVIYVHGRATREGEPSKSIREVIPDLAKHHGSVLMFRWPGSDAGIPFIACPSGEASCSGPPFRRVLEDVATWRRNHPGRVDRVVLLAHSMGSFVLEELLSESTESDPLPAGAVDALLLSSSAAKSKSHARWLRRVGKQTEVFVTVNRDDPVLRWLWLTFMPARLGKKLDTALAGPVELVADAAYLDVTDTEVDHRYFLRSTSDPKDSVGHAMSRIFSGKGSDLAALSSSVDSRDGARVYRLLRELSR